MVSNDLIQSTEDRFYVVFYNLGSSKSPCSLMKLSYENGKWDEQPGMKSVPMNEIKKP